MLLPTGIPFGERDGQESKIESEQCRHDHRGADLGCVGVECTENQCG